MLKKVILSLGFLLGFLVRAPYAFAANGVQGQDIVGQMSIFVLQISVIIFAAWLGGEVFSRFHFPSVLGEIISGVIIGPYCLGQFPFLGLEKGLFPIEGSFAVSIELYGVATLASIILLFFAGLETDLETLLRFSVTGFIVGLFGVIASFLSGSILGVIISEVLFKEKVGLFSPVPLFLGVISTATSVGITARILSEQGKINTPEGVSIIAAAVIDDVLGIITLAIAIGMVKSGHVGWRDISLVAVRAFGMWLGFTMLGLVFAPKISALLKKSGDRSTIAILSLALALLLSAVFERSGLAMIIGAYVMGLSLSKTDLSFIIQEKLEGIRHFFIPIFFCVMGMLVNLNVMGSGKILFFGFLYTILSMLGKFVGCGIPPLFLNFNFLGASRIGVGMIPRGEVALIVAGVGLSAGIIGDEIFSLAMIMTFATTLITPPVFSKIMAPQKSGLKRQLVMDKDRQTINFDMPSPETAELFLSKIESALEKEGFFVNRMGAFERIYQIRKEDVFLVMHYSPERISFDCLTKEASFVHTMFYEVIADMENAMTKMETLIDKTQAKIGKKIFDVKAATVPSTQGKKFNIPSFLALKANLKGRTKSEILNEMVDLLIVSGQLNQDKKAEAMKDVLAREGVMSTGMQDGIALPHAKTAAVDKVVFAAGVSKEGIEFDSLDKKPAYIFILTLASKENPHEYLQSLSEISRYLAKEENRIKVLSCSTNMQLYEALNLQ